LEATEKGTARKLAEPQAEAEVPPTKDGFYHSTDDSVEYELPGAASGSEPQPPFRPHQLQHSQAGPSGGGRNNEEVDEQKFLFSDEDTHMVTHMVTGSGYGVDDVLDFNGQDLHDGVTLPQGGSSTAASAGSVYSTIESLDIHGARFFELEDTHDGSRGSITMGLQIYPQLERECKKSGTDWDATREREEGARLQRLIGCERMGIKPVDPSHGDSDAEPKRLACMICRKRKLKCDGLKPSCSTCSRLGHTCAYYEARRKSGPKRGYVKALEERLSAPPRTLAWSTAISGVFL
jgi:hypothetical protein